MCQVEKDTGRQLNWAAVNHHDTDNPHVHIVVHGVDKNGDDLRIDGRYLGEGMRWRAQEILTRELGRRSEMDLAMERSLDVGRPHRRPRTCLCSPPPRRRSRRRQPRQVGPRWARAPPLRLTSEAFSEIS